MAVSQLAGPFPVVGSDGNPTFFHHAFYRDDIGICGFLRDLQYHVVQLDGASSLRNFGGPPFRPINYNLVNNSPLYYNIFTTFRFDPLNGIVLEAFYEDTSPYLQATGTYVFLGDRWLTISQSGGSRMVQSIYPEAPDVSVTDYVFGIIGGGGMFNTITSTGRGSLCLVWSDGLIIFYDHLRKKQLGPHQFLGKTPRKAFYSSKYGFIVGIHDDGAGFHEIRIWSVETEPSALSDPTIDPALTEGKSGEVSVVLTGDQGEPVADWLIDWSIISGPGTLSQAQSRTNESGIATTRVVASIGGTGTLDVQASIAF